MRILSMGTLALTVMLAGCSDGGGGGSGDTDGGNNTGPSLLDPFVGLWDITGDWDGRPGDEAYLAIREPDANNESVVLLYDFAQDNPDSGENCYIPPFDPGKLTESADDRIFLDHNAFDDATVTLSADDQSMTIVFFDTNDINGNSNTEETLTRTVSRVVGLTETDLQPLCS